MNQLSLLFDVGARIVEIGVYSQVGTSEPEVRQFGGVSGGMYGKSREEETEAMGVERAESVGKDVVRMVWLLT